MEPHQDKLISASAAAALLGLRVNTLRRWRIHHNGPRWIRMGDGPRARIFYRSSDVENWLSEHTVDPLRRTCRECIHGTHDAETDEDGSVICDLTGARTIRDIDCIDYEVCRD